MGKLFFEHANTQPKPTWVKGRMYQYTDESQIKLVRSEGLIQFNRMPLTEKNRTLDLVSCASYTFITLVIAAWIVSAVYITAKILLGV